MGRKNKRTSTKIMDSYPKHDQCHLEHKKCYAYDYVPSNEFAARITNSFIDEPKYPTKREIEQMAEDDYFEVLAAHIIANPCEMCETSGHLPQECKERCKVCMSDELVDELTRTYRWGILSAYDVHRHDNCDASNNEQHEKEALDAQDNDQHQDGEFEAQIASKPPDGTNGN